MNTTIEVLKQAREALVSESAAHITNKRRVPLKLSDAITALTAEIERLEKVEPVAIVEAGCDGYPWRTIGYLNERWLAELPVGTKLTLHPAPVVTEG